MRSAGLLAVAVAVAVLLLGPGCAAPPAGPEVVLDFAAAFPTAETSRETGSLRPARLADRSHFLEGWGGIVEGEDGSAVRGRGPSSSVRFVVLEEGPRRLALAFRLDGRVEGRPFVRIDLNGAPVAEVEIPAVERESARELPGRLLRRGDNRLDFRYGLGSGDERRFVEVGAGGAFDVAWSALTIDSSPPPAEPGVGEGTDGGVLRLPFRQRVDYYVRREAGMRIAVEGIRGPDGGSPPPGARLQVELRFDDVLSNRTLVVDPGEAPVELDVDVPAGAGPFLGVSFLAVAGPEGRGRGLTVRDPVLFAAAGAAPGGGPPKAGDRDRQAGGGAGKGEGRPFRGSASGEGPNVLVYLIDTLRADRLGVYGHDRPTSPGIDAFARRATVFGPAMALSSWTRTSVASLFTGLHPRDHGVVDAGDALPGAAGTMAELLRTAGHETVGFVTNSTVSADFRFDQGFHRYETLRERETREVHRLSDTVRRRFGDWLTGRRTRRPFFAYVHTCDPHDPYAPRSPFRERFAPRTPFPGVDRGGRAAAILEERPDLDPGRVRQQMVDLYDGEIAFNDGEFGKLVALLEERGLLDETLVVLTADHGEEFLDHGSWAHAGSLYEEVLRVPLIVRFPAGYGAGLRVRGEVSLVDVLPTVLDAVGLPVPEEVRGRSLLPVVGDQLRGPDRREGIGDGDRPLPGHLGLDRPGIDSLSLGGFKLIRYLAQDGSVRRVELFDLEADPGEADDLSSLRPVTRGYLTRRLSELRSENALRLPEREVVIDGEMRRRLRALGYIQ